jgi:hypothetical protein
VAIQDAGAAKDEFGESVGGGCSTHFTPIASKVRTRCHRCPHRA